MSGLLKLRRLKNRYFTESGGEDLRQSEEWKQTRDALFRILAPYPEVRVLVARELMKLELAGTAQLEDL